MIDRSIGRRLIKLRESAFFRWNRVNAHSFLPVIFVNHVGWYLWWWRRGLLAPCYGCSRWQKCVLLSDIRSYNSQRQKLRVDQWRISYITRKLGIKRILTLRYVSKNFIYFSWLTCLLIIPFFFFLTNNIFKQIFRKFSKIWEEKRRTNTRGDRKKRAVLLNENKCSNGNNA